MLDPSAGVFDQLPGLGIGGILAGFLIWLLNKTWRDHTEVIKGFHEIEKGRTDMLVSIAREISSNITKNTVVTESLHRRLDRDALDAELRK